MNCAALKIGLVGSRHKGDKVGSITPRHLTVRKWYQLKTFFGVFLFLPSYLSRKKLDRLSASGVDTVWQINHYYHFLLLSSKIKRSTYCN